MNNPKTLALSNEAVPQFPARPFQILTLLDMLEFFAYSYYLFIDKFEAVVCTLGHAQNQRGKQSPLKPEELDDLRHETSVLADELKQAGITIFETTLNRISEIREDCDDSPPPVLGSINRQLRRLRKDLAKDLHKQVFMSLSPEEIKYFNQEEKFGAEVKAKFPKANREITAASTCYAINNYTGCVFHLMRAVEYGARAMLKEFGVETHDNRPIELGDWGLLLDALKAERSKLSIGKRKDPQKLRDFEFYSYPIDQFEKFRVWRNKVSHLREPFFPGQTKDIMDDAERYVRHLAERLDEIGLKI
jgi:hypothetical protein